MPKLALVVSALFLLGSATACGTSGSSDANKTTSDPISQDTTTTTADDSDTTTAVDEEPDGPSTTVSGGDSASADDYVVALTRNLASGDPDNGDIRFTEEQAKCVAEEWVDIVGLEAFATNDVAPDDLGQTTFDYTELGVDGDQAANMVDAVDDCEVDWISDTRGILRDGLDPTQQTCLDDELTDETIRAVLVAGLYLDEPNADVKAEFERIEKTCDL